MHESWDDRHRAELQLILPLAGALLLLVFFGAASLVAVMPGADTLPNVVTPRLAEGIRRAPAPEAKPAVPAEPASRTPSPGEAAARTPGADGLGAIVSGGSSADHARQQASTPAARTTTALEHETVRAPVREQAVTTGALQRPDTNSVSAQGMRSGGRVASRRDGAAPRRLIHPGVRRTEARGDRRIRAVREGRGPRSLARSAERRPRHWARSAAPGAGAARHLGPHGDAGRYSPGQRHRGIDVSHGLRVSSKRGTKGRA